jgi:hypothetical protein
LILGLAGKYAIELDDHVARFQRAAIWHHDPVVDFRRRLGLDLGFCL